MKTIENTSEYKRNLNGSISCAFDHPSLGVIPNGLNPKLDSDLIAEIEAAGLIEEPMQAEKDAHEAGQARATFKAERTAAVQSLTITTQAGNVFDADETSQTRMARAISVMSDTDTNIWVLTDNTSIQVTKSDLIEALRLAGQAQSALWVQS